MAFRRRGKKRKSKGRSKRRSSRRLKKYHSARGGIRL